MTKAELIKAVEIKTDDTLAGTEQVIDFIRDTMVNEIMVTGRFVYPGFGIFTAKIRKPRVGRNPQNGKPVDIPAKRVVGFKMSADLKRLIG